ncbi:MAG: carbamoyltransferase HypF, partial [Spirochaetia bacterium]|nr:carbamoyltransferase HypF [Spirochaetia bacterium]
MQRVSAELKGYTQGIGLRPEIFRLAQQHKLTGFVKNIRSGVLFELQGESTSIHLMMESFSEWYIQRMSLKPEFQLKSISLLSESEFVILNSEFTTDSFLQNIPADRKICKKCSDEVFTDQSIRENFFFNSCTECGPRYSLFQGFPLDRSFSSWKDFPLCSRCEEEYKSITNRRLHAQNISCEKCGPQIKYEETGCITARGMPALDKLVIHLKNGGIAGVKSTGGVHFVCSAKNEHAVYLLREIKERYKKPFAVMYESIFEAQKHLVLSSFEKEMLLSHAAPVVVIPGNDPDLSDSVSQGIRFTGCMMPYNAIYAMILARIKIPLIVTSANLSDDPLQGDPRLIQDLIVQYSLPVLNHNLEIPNPIDDSVVRFAKDHSIRIRNGRGTAPEYFHIPHRGKGSVFCTGADMKNTFSLCRNERVILSPHTGNIQSEKSLQRYKKILENLMLYNDFQFEKVICDMHPDYKTSLYAESLGLPVMRVQHHHAHCMSLMAEHGMNRDAELLCASFDGTGFGTDGNIWGGEILLSSYKGFKRIAHLKYFKLTGSENTIREGYRTAMSLLFEMYGDRAEKYLPFRPEEISKNRHLTVENFYSLWKADEGVLTSSAGRLFDAAAAILGLLYVSDYEGQAGLIMESVCRLGKMNPYPFRISDGIIDWSETVEALLAEKDPVQGAACFIDTIADMAVRSAEPYGQIGITGGVFQNAFLVGRIKELAEKKKMQL